MIGKGKSVYLRYLKLKDAESLLTWENDPNVWKYGANQSPYSLQDMRDFIRNDNDLFGKNQERFMICLIGSGKAVGCIDLFDYNQRDKSAGIGILIYDNNDRRKGYGSDALSVLLEYAVKKLEIGRLRCRISSENVGSIKLFEHCGFQKNDRSTDKTKSINEHEMSYILA